MTISENRQGSPEGWDPSPLGAQGPGPRVEGARAPPDRRVPQPPQIRRLRMPEARAQHSENRAEATQDEVPIEAPPVEGWRGVTLEQLLRVAALAASLGALCGWWFAR